MKKQLLTAVLTTSFLALSPPAQSAGGSHGGGGGGGSHGGGNGGGMGESHAAEPKEAKESKEAKTEHMAHTEKTPAQQLTQNKKLADNLSKLLPPGTDLQAASEGFKNLGQFVAAVHVSKNLGIPFADLKTKMMDGASLGGAIKALRPDADADAEAKKAERQAKA